MTRRLMTMLGILAFAATLQYPGQALDARIEELRAKVSTLTTHAGRVEALSNRNAELEARLAALESLLVEDPSLAQRR